MHAESDDDEYSSALAYIDILSLLLSAFVVFFLVLMASKSQEVKKDGVQLKAEFMIEMTWPDKAFDDVDMHMLLPDGKSVYYSGLDKGYAVLERDDRGASGDTVPNPDGTYKLIEQNKEMITIRGIVPGRYVINARVYRVIEKESGLEPDARLPYKATFTLSSLNPRVKQEVKREVELTEVGKEVTAFSFVVGADGKISQIDTSKEFVFIGQTGSPVTMGEGQ